ncbi:MAG: hypothetical protein LCH38_02700 [Proteobacteria bacterium]|nr:hypothetical protein [Pseudomonadota bacterium]
MTDLPPGRECGTCTLCCKLFPVPELEKPAGRWCRHIAQGRGCGIHETRPEICRAFFCQWVYNADLGPEWKPEVSRFVLSIYPGSNSLVVTADPGAPAAWRAEPYLRNLRRWAEAALAQGDQVLVMHGARATAILPDREVELGEIGAGDRIATYRGPGGYDVKRIPAGAANG